MGRSHTPLPLDTLRECETGDDTRSETHMVCDSDLAFKHLQAICVSGHAYMAAPFLQDNHTIQPDVLAISTDASKARVTAKPDLSDQL